LIGGGIRSHLPLLRIITFLIGLHVLLAWGLVAVGRDFNTSSTNADGLSWSPALTDRAPFDGWLPYSVKSGNPSDNSAYWLRVPLEPSIDRDPRLFILNAVALSAYDGPNLLYSYDPLERGHRLNLLYHWNLVPLPSPPPAEIYLLLNDRGSKRPPIIIKQLSHGDFISSLVRKETYAFALSALFLFCFFLAVGLYFIRREKLQLYFALMALCGCYATAVRTYLLQLLWDQPWLGFVELSVFPLGVYGFLGIILEVFEKEHTKAVRFIGRIILGFSLLSLACSIFLEPERIGWLLSYPMLTIFLITSIYLFKALRNAYRHRQGPESIWMMAGFFIVTATALLHILRTYLTVFFAQVRVRLPFPDLLQYDFLSVALLLFLICLVRVILFRFGVMNDQLQLFNQALEKRVQIRTSELRDREEQLREANAHLAGTMKDTADAIASSMVLEERHRMTGAIHDTIGHSMTATLVQLEAAKRLLDRDTGLALEKLDASQHLVQRGLEAIRDSAKLLRDDSSTYDLADAIHALIEDTEKSTGVVVESRIGHLPNQLPVLHKRVLFQALQEGLTNGLRHGGSRSFHFTLDTDGFLLLFRLASDGRTYAPTEFGFGLKAMSERISGLGGSMDIAPGDPGCVLNLSFPLPPSEESRKGARQA